MHGLVNAHKVVSDRLPLFRPILAAVGTPTYKPANFLIPLPGPLLTNDCTINEFFLFADELESFNSKLVTDRFDIKSVFTNITLEETIDLYVEIIFKDETHVDNFLKYFFLE